MGRLNDTERRKEKGRIRRHCAAGSYRQLKPGLGLAERIEMYVCSHLFLTVAGEVRNF